MGYNWKKRLGEELKTEKNVRDCGGLERTLADGRYGFSRRRCLRRWAACFQGYTGILTE